MLTMMEERQQLDGLLDLASRAYGPENDEQAREAVATWPTSFYDQWLAARRETASIVERAVGTARGSFEVEGGPSFETVARMLAIVRRSCAGHACEHAQEQPARPVFVYAAGRVATCRECQGRFAGARAAARTDECSVCLAVEQSDLTSLLVRLGGHAIYTAACPECLRRLSQRRAE